jgi:phage baseplate assembly protein gpV
MPNTAKVYELTQKAPCFGPALVLAVDEAAHLIQVRLLKKPGQPELWCRPVLSLEKSICSGDEVLFMGEGMDDIYIVDRLAHSRATVTNPGAFVKADAEKSMGAHEIVKVFSRKKELIFEYDVRAEKARIHVPSGDLDFVTDTGDITLNAAGKLKLSGEKIEVTGRSGVSLGISRHPGDATAAIALDAQKVNIDGPEIKINAKRGAFFFTEMRYAGEKIVATAGSVQIMARRLETAAKTILEKADNVYRKIKQLSQVQAGRKRIIVDDTFYVKSNRAVMKSDKNFKVKSDKIHLG